MLQLTLPDSWHSERCWISDVVLGEFLGIEHERTFDHTKVVRISAGGKTLEWPDAFPLATSGRPNNSLQEWTVAASGLGARLSQPSIPVLFGKPGFMIDASGNAVLSLDVFGSAFFMLARYEEATAAERDCHDRFPAEASLASRLNFLNRPIVDEHVEILWAAMTRLWPTLKRKPRTARKLISCDVDLPFDPACTSFLRLGKRLLGSAWRRRSFSALSSAVGNYWAVRHGNQSRDPYWEALFWIMDVNEKSGNQVTFNIIPEPTDGVMDNAPCVDEPRMRKLLRAIHSRGHLIGIHPGYNTFRHPAAFSRSVAILRRALDEEGIGQNELGGRQHYLRWNVKTTPGLWAANELSYDSTLSYPSVAGFRAGTCHEYTMFDLVERKPLRLKQRPLIVMENAVIEESNMAFGHGERALEVMQHYKLMCQRFDGDFTLLWHNSSLTNKADQAIYRELIK